MTTRRYGPQPKADALRRNPEHRRKKLQEWRDSNPDQRLSQSRRHEDARVQRYRDDPASYLWKLAEYRARKQGVPFDIEPSDISVPEFCPLTGEKLMVRPGPRHDGAMSLDRVVNELGYVKGNVRVISRRGNRMKGDLTLADLDLLARYIKGEI